MSSRCAATMSVALPSATDFRSLGKRSSRAVPVARVRGSRVRAPLARASAASADTAVDWEALDAKMQDQTTIEILSQALDLFGDELAIAFSGAEDVAGRAQWEAQRAEAAASVEALRRQLDAAIAHEAACAAKVAEHDARVAGVRDTYSKPLTRLALRREALAEKRSELEAARAAAAAQAGARRSARRAAATEAAQTAATLAELHGEYRGLREAWRGFQQRRQRGLHAACRR